MAAEILLQAQSLSLQYKLSRELTVDVLNNFNISLPWRSTLALIGPSGCGKSSFIRILIGMLEATSGCIKFNSYYVASQSTLRIGYMDQESTLLPNLTVARNVALPRHLFTREPIPDEEVLDALDLVDLKGFALAYPYTLSGGMRQRVSLARALATQPNLLCLDEPFAAVDEILREKLMKELSSIVSRLHLSCVLVTHSITEAVFLANTVAVLSDKPCHVKRVFDVSGVNGPNSNSPDYYAKVCEIRDVLSNE